MPSVENVNVSGLFCLDSEGYGRYIRRTFGRRWASPRRNGLLPKPAKPLKIIDLYWLRMGQYRASTNGAQTLSLTSRDCQITGA